MKRARVVLGLAALLVGLLAGSAWGASAAESDSTARPGGVPLEINRATPAEIRALPLPPAVAEAILDHRAYVAPFASLFDLLRVKGMTPELLQRLRPLVATTPVFESARQEQEEEDRRSSELNYLVQRLLSEEGASEGAVDDYVDQLRDPRNLNRLDLFDLLSYQNVSPVDAVAILRERRRSGTIENARQLRAVPGISYYGYRNLRDYLRYQDAVSRRRAPAADYQFRLYDTPYVLDDADILHENILGDTQGLTDTQKRAFRSVDLNTYAGRLDLNAGEPWTTNKLRVRSGTHLKAALLTHRNLAEPRWYETAKAFVSLEDLPPRHTDLGDLRLHGLVLGNYSLAFGQGLVMESGDFFQPRRTGYGYSVRRIGLRGDASRSEEFALRGVAAEASLGRLRATSFYSRDNKDAILNPDGSFNRYIRMVPRLSDDLLAGLRSDITTGVFAGRGDTSAFLPMRDVMDERIYGANVKAELTTGTWVGMTGMEIHTRNRIFGAPIADRWDPRASSLVIDPGRIQQRDAEIGGGYRSVDLGNYRRVWGAEAQTVWRNLALAGEYARLDTASAGGRSWLPLFSRGPEAFLGHAWLQYENFNVLALYRDYDVGYDNPYARGFAEDARYEQTILDGNAFRLKNPYWAQLSRTLPQPKAERGWYFTTRYQISRQFTLNALEYDTWTRKADAADLWRVALRAEYRPIFPVRLRLRHAVSSRHGDRPDDIRNYRSWDSRFELYANLSQFDQVRCLYSTSNVRFAARGRLSGPAAGGDTQDDTTAVRGVPGRALQGAVTHNFNHHLAVTLSAEVYDGFLYNFEDNEFVVVDGKGFRTWFLLRSRLSDRLSWRLKWTSDRAATRTYVDIRDYGNLLTPTPDAVNAGGGRSSFRFQLDCSL